MIQNMRDSWKKNPSWKANSCSHSQEVPRLLWDMKVHYHVHKSPVLDPSYKITLYIMHCSQSHPVDGAECIF
jgi:hypothetical protein